VSLWCSIKPFCVPSFCWVFVLSLLVSRLAGTKVFEMTRFVSSGLQNLNSVKIANNVLVSPDFTESEPSVNFQHFTSSFSLST